jgi:hypothetical protein
MSYDSDSDSDSEDINRNKKHVRFGIPRSYSDAFTEPKKHNLSVGKYSTPFPEGYKSQYRDPQYNRRHA